MSADATVLLFAFKLLIVTNSLNKHSEHISVKLCFTLSACESSFLQMVFLLADVMQVLTQDLSVCVCLPAAFEITIDHPHTHVVKCTQLVRGECGLPPHIPSVLCEEHLGRLSMFVLLSVSLQPVRTWLRLLTLWPPTGSATERHRCSHMLFPLVHHSLIISSLALVLPLAAST